MELYLLTPDLFLWDIRKEKKISTLLNSVKKKNIFLPSSCDIRGHVKLFDKARKNETMFVINWTKS